ncbi:MAG TPA: CPBP family glutamic-type intramembrane protease [Candidatus Binatus sp.]|nr:CPBP family glutamic-type intramembrane protease [Candidatus Binatus sp.]
MSAQTPHVPASIFSPRRHPVICYFGLTFFLSWLGAFLVAAPRLLRGQSLPNLTGILMFPAMLVGPSLSSILLTRFFDGSAGLRDLFYRMRCFRFPARWYAALLIPSFLALSILLFLKTFVSPVYSPNRFWLGLAFGIPAGFFEEIGWTGFAFPKMSLKLPPLRAAILLGLLWGLWHIPVINFLGTAVPHGAYWLHFFIAFTAAMTAMRVLISWLYAHTKSIPLAQLMHACSTGSLVVFSPPAVNASQEAFWYAAYAAALWLLVAVLRLSQPGFPAAVSSRFPIENP